MRRILLFSLACSLVAGLSGGLIGCDEATDAGPGDYDFAEELEPGGLLGKEDGAGKPGPFVNTNTRATQVWTASENWEDTDTPAARAAGMAWGADSGLNWDEKFSAWIGSLEQIDALGYGKTFQLMTPFGKSLPAPKLDCADVAIMLRASFAAWYKLPFYMTASDGRTTVYFGHFGIRTSDGVWNNMPSFGNSYRDYTDGKQPSEWQGDWPMDKVLRTRGIQKGDEQAILGGLRTGAYLDEIHLNKRAGRFIRLLMIFTGSPHLADSRNTYNLVPESLRAGDTLLYRRARNGSGHTMVAMRVEDIGAGQLEVESAYGNLPPDQPSWEDSGSSKRRFTNNEGGGPTSNSIGEVYAEIGGGLKRWRVTKNVGGYWTNTWMKADESSWINDRDFDRIAARPARFEDLLGEVSPERRRDILLETIELKRRHLHNYPASCSAREGREQAFDDLYEVMADAFNMNKVAVDNAYRTFEDYVFAELDYNNSKTCCWNSTTPAMYEIVMDYNRSLQDGQCAEPEVFKAVAGDYAVFLTHAAAMDREGDWVQWTEDETCPQKDVLHDVETDHRWTAWCSLEQDGGGDEPVVEACVDDAMEPNDSVAGAVSLAIGEHEAAICGGSDDYYLVEGDGGVLDVLITFRNDDGDLDLELLDADGRSLEKSAQTSNLENVKFETEAGALYIVRVYGYRGAEGTYTLDISLE